MGARTWAGSVLRGHSWSLSIAGLNPKPPFLVLPKAGCSKPRCSSFTWLQDPRVTEELRSPLD